MAPHPTRILMVCMGNICRSPMAQAVLRDLVRKAGAEDQVEVDSAGTSPYRAGGPVHPGTLAILRAKGIDASDLVCRGVTDDDFARCDRLLAVDRENLRRLEELQALQRLTRPRIGGPRLELLLPYGSSGELDLGDPFLDGGFAETFDRVEDACRGLLDELLRDPGEE